MRASQQRLASAIDAVLGPEERLASTGVGWAAQPRSRVPLLFLARRQYWFALTDRRVLIFGRHWRGPRPEDLVLGKRYSFFTLEKVHSHRILFQLRIRSANESRLVLEFRPGHRAVAAELAARLTRALPPAALEPAPGDATSPPATAPAAPPTGATSGLDQQTAAAFWGDR